VQDAASSAFSAERVVNDIEVISRNHHSVAHPQERAEVRDYLVSRLGELGADTVHLFEYKSLTGPENKHVTYTFDATNVLATFAPENPTEQTTYLLMVAHYDSRYSQPIAKSDTVWSYGAADDGYGVGVILETVAQALKYRADWKQGVKVLFTDAEEVGMKGMKAMWENNREEFNDVGFMINIEARGPFGPALLFETSPGNEKVMELYESAAEYPFTYSLTTVVYGFMPNFTDFTIVKDEIPGMNFSTIADINHYHTDLDNFSNVNPRSIQHYGSQVVPVVHSYLTDDRYSSRDSLLSDADTINFTLPLIGLFNFTKGEYIVLNSVVLLLFVIALVLEVLRGRVQLRKVLWGALKALLAAIAALAAGELVAIVACLVTGVQFKPFGIVQGIPFDNAAMAVSAVVMVLMVVWVHIGQRKKAVNGTSNSLRKSAKSSAALAVAANKLYATLLLMALLSLLLLIFINENLMFFIPLTLATFAVILYRLTRLKLWFLLAIALILLHAFSFLYALAMALTIGALGAVLMLAILDVLVVVPLVDMYVTRKPF
ncbi:MAG: M20/M25/M40 family metallo-hydrolase, partial [Bacteroidaceae bacterium]|nr:M20/M25/M40 family metallo-hydrolase [Bacteroidaceae bacterium]